jgi:hypothetical protein
MLRSSLTTAGILLASASAFAQTQVSQHAVQVYNGPIRDAGIYHAATGTWTRHANQANLGADVIYNNSAPSAPTAGQYYIDLALAADIQTDEGQVPSPTHPTNLMNRPGCATSYVVDGYQVGWCTDQAVGATGDLRISFYENYTPCTSVLSLTPVNSVQIRGVAGGLPGNFPGAAGAVACWFVVVDPANAPVTTAPVTTFTLQGDADGSYDGTNDYFGVSFASTLPAGTPRAGVIIAGNTNTATGYQGTRWDTVINYNLIGTGMGTQNFFYSDGATPNCYYYGTAVNMASYYVRLFSNACGPTDPGTSFCFGDGSGTACSCAGGTPNPSAVGDNVGCLNSLGTGGKLRAAGVASIGADTVVLNGSQMPNSSCLYFQGTVQQNGGLGSAFGDGLRCAGGTVIRLGTKANVAGASAYPVAGDPTISVRGLITTPGTRTYQAWYRNSAVFCVASATFNLSNGHQIVWAP